MIAMIKALGTLLAPLGNPETITWALWRRWSMLLSISPLKRGMGGPGLQQGAIHRKMLIAEKRRDLWSRHSLFQEAAHDLVIDEPLVVLGKGGGVPDRIVRAQATNQRYSRL